MTLHSQLSARFLRSGLSAATKGLPTEIGNGAPSRLFRIILTAAPLVALCYAAEDVPETTAGHLRRHLLIGTGAGALRLVSAYRLASQSKVIRSREGGATGVSEMSP